MKFVVKRGKREEYIKAWLYMYKADKEGFKDPIYDGVNPALNKKPLGTETDNFCVIVYDNDIDCKESGFEYGRPVGIFCFVITPRQNIGKQYIVTKEYLGKGVGKILLLENEKLLKENGYDKYYIGCSHCSAGIYKKYIGIEPYNSNEEHDMYKFNVDLNREAFDEQYNNYVKNNENVYQIVNENDEIIFNKDNEVVCKDEHKNKCELTENLFALNRGKIEKDQVVVDKDIEKSLRKDFNINPGINGNKGNTKKKNKKNKKKSKKRR